MIPPPGTCTKSAVVPEHKLIWTPVLLALIPDLMKVAHCDQPKAKAFIEKVLAFVEGHNELSESMVGNILEAAGIKGLSRQKQHDVRKFLTDKGLIQGIHYGRSLLIFSFLPLLQQLGGRHMGLTLLIRSHRGRLLGTATLFAIPSQVHPLRPFP